MTAHSGPISPEIRAEIATAIREQGTGLTDTLAAVLKGTASLEGDGWWRCADALVAALAATVASGDLDSRDELVGTLARFTPRVSVRQMIRSIEAAERVVLDALTDHARIGQRSQEWAVVVALVHGGAFEVAGACAQHEYGRPAIRDPLTTLMSPRVLRLALQQEIARAKRHRHGVSVLLFEVDGVPALNARLGGRTADRLLERLGILARQFFRTHDWVARHGEHSIAVLLPETTVDQAAALATGFRDMVRQRIVLRDARDVETRVTLSAAATGTDQVGGEIDPDHVLAELEAAARRAHADGGDRTATVALLPTSVTIAGAASVLRTAPREVVRMIRRGVLHARRRGRHLHIEMAELEAVKIRA